MNWSAVEKVANAVLYEGYVLYPYRPSAVKNQQRFNFGVLYPRSYCGLQSGGEAWQMCSECLIEGPSSASLEVKARFLQMAECDGWQEGIERAVTTRSSALGTLVANPLRQEFIFNIPDEARACSSGTLRGEIEIMAARISSALDAFRVTLEIRNLVTLENPVELSREAVLLRSLASLHAILHAKHGQFVSLLDPPENFKAAASECRNVGAWPVLAGREGQRDLMLASPIILYDYPQIAPESAGNLCDSTEIDEILALRILTLTDAEKEEIRKSGGRAREILERTEALPPEQFQKLHGAVRGLKANTSRAGQ